MNIAVCIKQVPDTETKIKLNGDSSWIDLAGIKWIISPYDELAIEEAIRFKEKNGGTPLVTVFTVGPTRTNEALRTALAMGCDSAVQVDASETIDNFLAAKALAGAIKKEGAFDLVFCGKEAIDDGAAQTTQLISEFLGFPCLTVVLGIEYGAGTLKCKREVEGGAIEMIETPTPVVIAAQKGLNEPRYASLPNIMKAKKKEIKAYKLADVGASESDQKIKYKNLQLPPPKQAGKKIAGQPAEQAKELAQLLRNEAKVI
jgi:electron transfer flavoprotein beta subunit